MFNFEVNYLFITAYASGTALRSRAYVGLAAEIPDTSYNFMMFRKETPTTFTAECGLGFYRGSRVSYGRVQENTFQWYNEADGEQLNQTNITYYWVAF